MSKCYRCRSTGHLPARPPLLRQHLRRDVLRRVLIGRTRVPTRLAHVLDPGPYNGHATCPCRVSVLLRFGRRPLRAPHRRPRQRHHPPVLLLKRTATPLAQLGDVGPRHPVWLHAAGHFVDAPPTEVRRVLGIPRCHGDRRSIEKLDLPGLREPLCVVLRQGPQRKRPGRCLWWHGTRVGQIGGDRDAPSGRTSICRGTIPCRKARRCGVWGVDAPLGASENLERNKSRVAASRRFGREPFRRILHHWVGIRIVLHEYEPIGGAHCGGHTRPCTPRNLGEFATKHTPECAQR